MLHTQASSKQAASRARMLVALPRLLTLLLLAPITGESAPVLYIHDSGGRLGKVDVQTGQATVLGNMGVILTDIAFAPSGDLYGISFDSFYRINPNTAATTYVGNHGIPGGNALVFSEQGVLYAAGADSTLLFRVDPNTGLATVLGNIGFRSAGDLAFKGGELYLSSTTNQLVRISLQTFHGTAVGALGYSSVFGLATGDDAVLYGIAGTTVFAVDTASGAGSFRSDYRNQGLTSANGGSFALEAVAARLVNLSTRVLVQTGDSVSIGGSIITGSIPKKILFRAIGPSLTTAGIQTPLFDPTIELFQGGQRLATNDNWRDTQQAEILATGLAPSNDFESATIQTLMPGGYTVIMRGKNAGTGIALVEAYDLDVGAPVQLGNISTRGFVGSGDNVLIGGFVMKAKAGSHAAQIVVRAIGPTLVTAGVAGALNDPTLTVFNSSGVAVASNDDWKTSQRSALEAVGLAPSHDLESALLMTLPPGAYTAIVRGYNGSAGVGLVEVYYVGAP